MNIGIHRDIQRKYELKRQKSVEDLKKRKEQIYKMVPDIESIDQTIASLGIEYNKAIILGKKSFEAIDDLSERIESLKKNKVEILRKYDIESDCLEQKFECEVCKDSGYIKNENRYEKCTCYTQQLIDHIYSKSNLYNLESQNFNFFDLNKFSDVVDEKKYGSKLSPKKSMSLILKKAKEFIENIENYNYKGVLFTGNTGTGKTFLSNCISKELLDHGRTVIYLSAPNLFHMLKNFRTSNWSDQKLNEDMYNYIMEAEILIIDDLGIENVTTARYSELLNILNTRGATDSKRVCKTIISTNLGYKEMLELYNERVVSRIVGEFYSIRFIGEDLRFRK